MKTICMRELLYADDSALVAASQHNMNKKPLINSLLRRMIPDKDQALKAGDINEYRKKQTAVDAAIKTAKLEYKDKVEQHFKSNKMKDPWKGLKLLTGQKEGKKVSTLTNILGSADSLNSFYSHFDKGYMHSSVPKI